MYASNSGVPLCSHASSGSSSWVPSPSCRAIATFVCKVASWLPGPRDPECSRIHVPPSWSVANSMKWFPEPSEPSCASARCGFARVAGCGFAAIQALAAWENADRPLPIPAGIPASHPLTHASAWSRASATPRSTFRAAMPHPMSTPTADGITAVSVGITDPIVAP
jgi:hypothetical protein